MSPIQTTPPQTITEFSNVELASVLEAAEQELVTRGWCTGHTSLPTGEVCGVGAINVIVFGHPDGQYYYQGSNLSRQIALRDSVAAAMGFDDFVAFQGGFNDRLTSPDPVIVLFSTTRERLLAPS